MRVLVHQSYGSIKVYKAELPADFELICDAVGDGVQGWGIESVYTKMREMLEVASNAEIAERILMRFYNAEIRDPLAQSHESFETFEFANLQGSFK